MSAAPTSLITQCPAPATIPVSVALRNGLAVMIAMRNFAPLDDRFEREAHWLGRAPPLTPAIEERRPERDEARSGDRRCRSRVSP